MAAVADNQSSGNMASHGPDDVAGKPPSPTSEDWHCLLPVVFQQVESAGIGKVHFNWPSNNLLAGTCHMAGLSIYPFRRQLEL